MALNSSFFFDVSLLLIAAIAIPRLLYIRLNRETFFRKHNFKPGTPEYDKFTKLTDTRVLGVVLLIAGLVIVKTVFDTYAIVHTQGRSALTEIWTIVGFVALIVAGVSLAIYNLTRGDDN